MTKEEIIAMIEKEQSELKTMLDNFQKEIAYRNGRISALKELSELFNKPEESPG